MTKPRRGRPMDERKKRIIAAIHCTERWRDVYQHDRALYEAFLVNLFSPNTFRRHGRVSSKALTIPQLLTLLRELKGEIAYRWRPHSMTVIRRTGL